MKMKRLFIIAATALFLTACGSANLNVEALTKSLSEEITYSDKLNRVSDDFVENYFTLEEGVEVVMYMGSGITADEFAIFTCKDPATAQKQEEHIKEFVADQTASFANYIPQEAKKLGDCVIIRKGKFVVLSVSDNPDAAKTIIKNAF